jgi:hypothetical protein
VRRCRYCQRDIRPQDGTAWWVDGDGLTTCGGNQPPYQVHLPQR